MTTQTSLILKSEKPSVQDKLKKTNNNNKKKPHLRRVPNAFPEGHAILTLRELNNVETLWMIISKGAPIFLLRIELGEPWGTEK